VKHGHRGLFIAALSIGACIGGCEGSDDGAAPVALSPTTPLTPTPVHVEGAVQKGPFLVGSTVLINRRDARGISTSSTILSEIEDSIGSFDFVTTDPGLVQIAATGYYFSELTGEASDGMLTLRALYEIGDEAGQKAYVNIMTHLINDRVLALLAAGNIDAAGAIAKAEAELVKALQDALPVAGVEGFSGLSVYNTGGSAGVGVGNTYLLALSTGFYEYAAIKAEEFGTATDAELTLVLNRISDDLATDGDLDTKGFIRDFTRAIRSLSPETIAENLRRRAIVDYPLGLDVPDISAFLNLCAGNFACPWRAGAPMPQETDSHATAVHGGKVYLFGGITSADDICLSICVPPDAYRDVYAYDPVANAWEARAPLPVGMSQLSAYTVGEKIYVIPSLAVRRNVSIPVEVTASSNTIFEYDPATDRWTQKAPRPSYRSAFAAAAVDGKIYVIGGRGEPDNGPSPEQGSMQGFKAHVEIYDPATNTWSAGHPAPIAMMGRTSCAVGHQIYVFGVYAGDVGSSRWDPSLFVYDVAADQWSVKAPVAKHVIDRACVATEDAIWLFGGFDRSMPLAQTTDRVDVYDPLADSWASDTRLPTTRHRASASRIGNEVFVFGGQGTYITGTTPGRTTMEWRRADVVEILNLDVLADDAVP
jgi:N-acetylneuraminic acid mutarotase